MRTPRSQRILRLVSNHPPAKGTRRMDPTTTAPDAAHETAGYQLTGSLLEACSCEVLCPCWIGEDPDHGTCEAFNAYHFDSGTIGGVDVSGLSFVSVHRIPGNVLAGNWRAV